jgi:hypothetical protein
VRHARRLWKKNHDLRETHEGERAAGEWTKGWVVQVISRGAVVNTVAMAGIVSRWKRGGGVVRLGKSEAHRPNGCEDARQAGRQGKQILAHHRQWKINTNARHRDFTTSETVSSHDTAGHRSSRNALPEHASNLEGRACRWHQWQRHRLCIHFRSDKCRWRQVRSLQLAASHRQVGVQLCLLGERGFVRVAGRGEWRDK